MNEVFKNYQKSDIYSSGGLNLQEREMITISSLLTSGGCEAQLEIHINGALNVGVTCGSVGALKR